jgi:hypothetical protein
MVVFAYLVFTNVVVLETMVVSPPPPPPSGPHGGGFAWTESVTVYNAGSALLVVMPFAAGCALIVVSLAIFRGSEKPN